MNTLRHATLATLLLAAHVGAQDIPVTSPSSAASRASFVAFTGATVIDGTGREPIANAVILVTNGRITAIGPAAQVKVPAAAEHVALNGKFIIPGLINAHGHVNTPDDLKKIGR